MPGICRVSVEPQLGTSDHFSVSAKVQLNSPVPDFTISKRVHLMSRANWDAITAEVHSINWREIVTHASPADQFNSAVSTIISRFVPSKVIKLRSRDRPWFNENCRAAYHRKQTAFHRWTRNRTAEHWEAYRVARNAATVIFNRAEVNYNRHIKEKLTGSSNSYSWWRNLKYSLFGTEQSVTPLKKPDGSVTFAGAEKAELLANYFNSKMSRNTVEIPSGCFPSPKLHSVAFRSSEVQKILQNLDEHGGTDSSGLFPSFFKRFSTIFAPKLSVLFRKLIQSGNFPDCWKVASITPIPKEGSPCNPKDYRPISITPILSKVFERLLARRLSSFVEAEKVLPNTQFGFRKGLGTIDALLTFNTDVQAALNEGMEVRAVAIDFSAAFDKVNHSGIIFQLKNIGVGGKFLELCQSFLSNRRQYVTVDGCSSTSSDVYSGVPQGSVLGPLFFVIYTSSMFAGLSCSNVAYADDTTIYVIIPKPADRRMSAERLSSDLSYIKAWCVQWGMELNPIKTKSAIFTRSRTMLPEHPDINLGDSTIENVTNLKLLGVLFDSKMTFELHVRAIASKVSQKIGILRKCWQTYQDNSVILKCFYAFILPFFEYCSAVWMSAASTHLKVLERVFTSARFLTQTRINLEHRRDVAASCMLFKILSNAEHPMQSRLPLPADPARRTRRAARMNSRAMVSALSPNSVQFNRTFLPHIIEIWNFLPQALVDASSIDTFKSNVNKHLLRVR